MPAPTIEYQPYDDDSQLARYIDRYPLSFKRTPLTPLIPRPLTLSERTGPNGADLSLPVRWTCLSRAKPPLGPTDS